MKRDLERNVCQAAPKGCGSQPTEINFPGLTNAVEHWNMRKQYHRRYIGSETHVWDVHKLIRAASDLPHLNVPVEDIAEIDENWWYQEPDALPTPRSVAHHLLLVHMADLAYPVILCSEGRIMDGMHRVVKALVENRKCVSAVRFPVTPAPDFVNVSLDDLPYPNETI